MNAPNSEAKLSAVQLRNMLFLAIEQAIENDWEKVGDLLAEARALVGHLENIEKTYNVCTHASGQEPWRKDDA